MDKIGRLLQSYSTYISLPWRDDAAAPQRVVFCVYPEHEELRLRVRIDEFELATSAAQHEWFLFDLTDTFAEWMSSQRYARRYFEKPALLQAVLPKYLPYLERRFDEFLAESVPDENAVVALKGVGSLFGFVKVKSVVDAFAPRVSGKLVVFFPGSFEDNNYRLLDGYDGWNYLAVPLTPGRDF